MKDKWIRIVGYPTVIIVMSWVYGKENWELGGAAILSALTISAMHTASIWEGARRIFIYARRRFPGYHQTARRIIVQSILTIGYTIIAKKAVNEIVKLTFGPEACIEQEMTPFFEAFIIFIPLVITSLVYESVYFFNAWKDNIKQTEALAHAHMESQFEALKKQLDPHFLFNSLNTLSSLIELDNNPAQEYLERLADVYRYVLDTREKSTVTLEEELQFLDAYMYLNKVRFRENLHLEHELSPETFSKRIPALSLQLLVENAIKHNVVGKDQPLAIRIFKEGDHITVKNNKQLKTSFSQSTRIGLQNLIDRYKLLGAEGIIVKDETNHFAVSLPLL
ncbi:MAG: sensor histidine kinase [Bacteroidia bacterium]